jgi:hypothetical protein
MKKLTLSRFYYIDLIRKLFVENLLNLKEFFNNALFKTFIEVFAQQHIALLGNHASAKELLRNGIGLLTSCSSSFFRLNIGNSKYSYDAGNIVFAGGKLLCKGTVIKIYTYNYPNATKIDNGLENISRYSNYCDAVMRVAAIASQDRQDANAQDINWFQYFYDNMKYEWFIASIFAGVPKVFVGDGIHSILKNLQLREIINNTSTNIEKHALLLLDPNLTYVQEQSAVNKVHSISSSNLSSQAKVSASLGILLNAILSSLAEDYIASFMVVPATRITQNLAEGYIRGLIQQQNDHSFTQAFALTAFSSILLMGAVASSQLLYDYIYTNYSINDLDL